MKKKLTLGILAHVDAGKTTLSEALLYLSGKLRTMGRVDHKNAFLDTDPVERERGITIFSKQARFSTDACDVILLDTPGHVDFSPEAERILSLLDYAVLVISATDGVQSHTRTLWQLLELYRVPTLIFVNKTDVAVQRTEELEDELIRALSPRCVGFLERRTREELDERLALLREDLLESVLAGVPIEDGEIADLIASRRLFPCFFGSALRLQGVDRLIDALDRFTLSPTYPQAAFGAKVFKISNTTSSRLTYLKVTGGKLTARDELAYQSADGRHLREKVNQIRLYSGDRFQQVDLVPPGEICAVVGLSATYVGQGLGQEENAGAPVLEPVLSYGLILPPSVDPVLCFPKLKQMEEEEPSLHLTWDEELRQIRAGIMGEIQMELLKRKIGERFGFVCDFDEGQILYREKIASRTVGVGHFEPLRHYAEVQLLMEPQPKGTGLIFDARLPENSLALNWQRLILSHLYEKEHRGVCIGAPLTDTKITLVAGKAHLKHTEGGDFREATLRAVRQGLMKAGCLLLEPCQRFRIELPSPLLGRAMSDLQLRNAEFRIESNDGSFAVLEGRAPVSRLRGYLRELIAYSHGEGRMTCVPDGFEPCTDAEEIIAKSAYDPTADLENTPHSVFCDHGAGVVIPWDQVDQYKHLEVSPEKPADQILPPAARLAKQYRLSDEELEAIMLREFGPIKRRRYSEPKINAAKTEGGRPPRKKKLFSRRMVILDGYNVIYAWDSLREIASFSLEKAREALMDILSNYVAFTKTELVLVFDAYLVKDGQGAEFQRDGYRVVYTKQDQTADAYIERMMHELGPDYGIRVVTGDRLLQFSAVHEGILRVTAEEFLDEVTRVSNEITEFIRKLAEEKNRS